MSTTCLTFVLGLSCPRNIVKSLFVISFIYRNVDITPMVGVASALPTLACLLIGDVVRCRNLDIGTDQD